MARLEPEVLFVILPTSWRDAGWRFFDPGGRPGLPGFGTPVRQGRVAWMFRSPVHSSLHRVASNRPNACGPVPGPSWQARSGRAKCRCSVRSDRAHAACTRTIRVICVAVRAGFPASAPPPASAPRTRRRASPGPSGGSSAPRPGPACRTAGVLAVGQLTDQPAPLAGRQLRVDHVPDQLIPEQRGPPGPLSPVALLLLSLAHFLLPSNTGESSLPI